MEKEIIIYGGTGQAKVLRPIIEHYGSKVCAVIDDTPGLKAPFADVPLCTGYEGFKKWFGKKNPAKFGFVIAIGNPHAAARLRLHAQMKQDGFVPVSILHPSAIIAPNAVIGEGAQILAGAIIQPEAVLGTSCIVNTGASVDHECILEDGVEIGPGAVLAGIITVKQRAWVATGAVVLPRLTIGKDAIVGAGAVATKDVPAETTVVGIPAKAVQNSK